jgi:hypothetical protein
MMCEFASWKEYKSKVYFLKDSDLNTKEGKKLLKPEVIADICGHGAIEHYYPELARKGENKECNDFSTPANFPKEIVRAIKSGKITRIGISLQLLNAKGRAEYEKVEGQAWAEYEKVEGQAWAEYEKVKGQAWAEHEKVEGQAWAEYEKVEGPALAEYEKVKGQAWAEYKKVEGPAWAEYEKVKGQAWAEYEKVEGPALAEYEKVKGPALAEYEKVKGPAFWKIFKDLRNRNEAWR